MRVEERGDLRILKAFVRHHMAPVAGGIPDAQKNGLLLPPRGFKRFRAPGVPVHGVLRVLEQIGADLVLQTVHCEFLSAAKSCFLAGLRIV